MTVVIETKKEEVKGMSTHVHQRSQRTTHTQTTDKQK